MIIRVVLLVGLGLGVGCAKRQVMAPPVPAPAWTEAGAAYRMAAEGLVIYAVGKAELPERECAIARAEADALGIARTQIGELLAAILSREGKTTTTEAHFMLSNVRVHEAWYDGDRTLHLIARLELPRVHADLAGIPRLEETPSGGRPRQEVEAWIRKVYGSLCP